MYPVLFRIGGLVITSFGVMMALAFLTAGWISTLEMRRKGDDPEVVWDLVVFAAIGGILGARIYYIFLYWRQTVADPVHAIFARSGLVWYGGFILAALLVAWRVHKLHLSIPRIADVAAPALALAYAVGRVGCFLVGDDYGRPTNLPWGIAFPNGAPPSTAGNLRDQFGVAVPPGLSPDTVLRVHPTQLYEVGMSLIIFAILWSVRRRFRTPGLFFAFYLMLAGAERFIVEIFRAKDDRFVGPLTIAQLVSLGLIALGLVGVLVLPRTRSGTQVATTPAR